MSKPLKFALASERLLMSVIFRSSNTVSLLCQIAEMEGDNSLFIKAEAAIRESYGDTPDGSGDILYLWGYILFKQARYAEPVPNMRSYLR